MPNYKRYMTVDELHQRNADLVNEYPGAVGLIDLGKSAGGEIIDCLKIGDGRHNALIHGFPNCGEPSGGNLLDCLAEALLHSAVHGGRGSHSPFLWQVICCKRFLGMGIWAAPCSINKPLSSTVFGV